MRPHYNPIFPNLNNGKNLIEAHIDRSSKDFARFKHRRATSVSDEYWVVKYMPTKYVEAFYSDRQLMVSITPGFTWGDAVYVAPLSGSHAFSNAIFGRAGIVGQVNLKKVRLDRVFDASNGIGLNLYQNWIASQTSLYNEVTTMFNPSMANRYLRNKFRQTFNIDIVVFIPDQFNHIYTDSSHQWFAISDWPPNLTQPLYIPKIIKSDVVEGCKWTIIVTEDFTTDESQWEYIDNVGRNTVPKIALSDIQNKIISVYDQLPDTLPLQLNNLYPLGG